MDFKYIFNRIGLLYSILVGFCQKMKWTIIGIKKIEPLSSSNTSNDIVVSLTSYGRRAKNIVYYTIISLLIQKTRPNRIILWLDADSWNDDNLTKRMKLLKTKGVEIKYCKDSLKSYTKLVPSMERCPQNIIITVDDDIFYSSNLIQNLYKEHLKYPDAIICNIGKVVNTNNDSFLPYKSWKFVSCPYDGSVMALGYAGVLYPPNSLDSNYNNIAVFKKLCPLADDVWFWCMALKKGTDRKIANSYKIQLYPIDIKQYIGKSNDSLASINVQEDYNDAQIESVFDYFDLKVSDVKNENR